MTVRRLVARLNYAFVERVLQPRVSNLATNRRFWERCARAWTAEGAYLDVERSSAEVTNLGDEWGTPQDVQQVLGDFVFPNVGPDSVVVEVGVGGGRIAALVAPRVGTFYGFDISRAMLQRARRAVGDANAHLVLLRSDELPADLHGTVDLVYAFDVFVHLDVHTQWRYIRQFHDLLKPGGRALVHTTNLRARGGWERFAQQRAYGVRGHYFVVPELVDLLAERAGLRVVRRSPAESDNFYYARDYVALLEKPA